MTMTRDRIEELKRLTEKATPGPWVHDQEYGSISFPVHDGLIKVYSHSGTASIDANAAFIAAANPQTILSLLALAERALEPQGQALLVEYAAQHAAEAMQKKCFDAKSNAHICAIHFPPIVEAAVEAAYASQLALPAGPVPELAIGVTVDHHHGATIAIHQPHGDGTTTVLYSDTHYFGDSSAVFKLASPSPAVAQPVADERAHFEAWIISENNKPDFKGSFIPSGAPCDWYYFDDQMNERWLGWQARAALGQPAEEGDKA